MACFAENSFVRWLVGVVLRKHPSVKRQSSNRFYIDLLVYKLAFPIMTGMDARDKRDR